MKNSIKEKKRIGYKNANSRRIFSEKGIGTVPFFSRDIPRTLCASKWEGQMNKARCARTIHSVCSSIGKKKMRRGKYRERVNLEMKGIK